MEIWKDVKGYEGLYQVSNIGRVKRIPSIITDSNGVKRKREGRFLKISKSISGYYQFTLCKNGKSTTKTLHNILAVSFLNHNPNGYDFVIDHIDGDKLNNKLNNLQIISQRENIHKWNKKSSSKYIGVSYRKDNNKWRSRLRVKNKLYCLGDYETEYEAHLVYQKKLKELNL